MALKVEGTDLNTVVVSMKRLKEVKIISSSIPIKHINKQVTLDNKAVKGSFISALDTIMCLDYAVTFKLNTNNISIVITSGVGHHGNVRVRL